MLDLILPALFWNLVYTLFRKPVPAAPEPVPTFLAGSAACAAPWADTPEAAARRRVAVLTRIAEARGRAGLA